MILPVLAWIGFFSMLSQVLLLRELLVSFEGNELSLGLVLAAWLIWTGIGSAIWGLIARKNAGRGLLAGLLAVSGLTFPVTVTGATVLPLIIEQTRGELAGPASMAYPFLLLFPLCLCVGGLFPAASSVLAGRISAPRAAGRVYLLEALGGGLAGGVASILLTGISPLAVAVVLGFTNLLLAAALITVRRRLLLVIVLVAGCPLLLRFAGQVEDGALRSLWEGYQVVETLSSPYGKLALVETEGASFVFHNRVMLFGAADEQAVEERIHYPLLEHPAPQRVLMLGGGSPLALRQVLKHSSVRRLDYLEADPALIALYQRRFSQEWAGLASDQRVRIHAIDARRFVRTSREKWDVVIVGLPPPRTVLMNRYYTVEFFEEASKVLSPGGIIALQLPGAENYISDDLARFLACIRKTLSTVFPRVIVLPGPSVQFFAGGAVPDTLTTDPLVLMARVKERELHALYVREYLIPFRLIFERVAEIDRRTRT
ncbi:MAG: hypothetical protein EHM18_16750, partial [Acidobacteria bacterium]